MSKVFEAILKLERESGKLPPGVLVEAQEVLRTEQPVVAAADEPTNVREIKGEAGVPPGATSFRAERLFALDRVPVAEVTVSPETRLFYHIDPHGPGADRLRLLRMRLWPLWESGKLKTILVTSAHAHDGKSTVVMNLATALAEQGQRTVLVVEGDLYHPSISPRLGLLQNGGLAESLEEGVNVLSMLRRVDPLGWYLLSAGKAKGNPTELLQFAALGGIFETLQSEFDWIIVDTPPVFPLTDTLSLRQHTDAALLVVRAGGTPSEAVDVAVSRIGASHLLGIVLNGSDELDQMYSDYRKSYTNRVGVQQ